MNEQEEWRLCGATVAVEREGGAVKMVLCGVVTPGAYELLHARLAQERCQRRTLEIDDSALLVMTCRSAVEAAVRGTPALHTGVEHMVVLIVRPQRLFWALQHAALMAAEGLLRVVMAEGRAVASA